MEEGTEEGGRGRVRWMRRNQRRRIYLIRSLRLLRESSRSSHCKTRRIKSRVRRGCQREKLM